GKACVRSPRERQHDPVDHVSIRARLQASTETSGHSHAGDPLCRARFRRSENSRASNTTEAGVRGTIGLSAQVEYMPRWACQTDGYVSLTRTSPGDLSRVPAFQYFPG